MQILNLDQIQKVLPSIDVLSSMETGFAAYSNGEAVIPPVGELLFDNPRGDVHIKYGYLKKGAYYVVKVVSGFYDNPKLGLPTCYGLMLLFDKNTGELAAILNDQSLLTHERTGAAGAVAAKYLAPKDVHCIGILGAGKQARIQARYLKKVIPCRDLLFWTPNKAEETPYIADMRAEGFRVEPAATAGDVAKQCNLIVTVTTSNAPLLMADQIRPGTHISAVGADTVQKQELDENLFAKTDVIVTDSMAQCRERGDITYALRRGLIQEKDVCELGEIVVGKKAGRTSDDQITVADLTGVAFQDLLIAQAVYEASQG